MEGYYPSEGCDLCCAVEDLYFWFLHRNACIETLIRRFGSSSVFLDVSGGNGLVTQLLLRLRLTAILVEPSLKGCLNAHHRGISQVICGPIGSLSFERTKRVDSAGLFDAIEHVEDAAPFLGAVWEVLKPQEKI